MSVSSSKQMAAALGMHTELKSEHPEWNAEALYFSKERRLVDLYTDRVVADLALVRTHAKDLSKTFGANSRQVIDGLRLLDLALMNAQKEIVEMYEGALLSEVVSLSSTTEEHTFYTQEKQAKSMRRVEAVGDDLYSADQVTAFQTKFWVAIVLAIAFIAASITLVKMDMLESSLIYRTTDGPRPIPDVQ